ncbi:MAG: serine/threonine-protein kinase [Ornithinimicrobium sp.]
MTQELPVQSGDEDERRVGPYVLGPRLGEGGMGVVWRSTYSDGRDVSIKVLRPHIAHDENARARLRREVDTLARVHHPRVASVLDADVDGPAPYIVTEYVPGAPLDAVVAEQGPLGPEALVRLGEGLSEALAAIHEVGIVHRDLKPGNVLMVGDSPVVIDFGIAQVADDSRLTMTGMVMGTPGYLSPEVVEGGSVTRATDWWGWAATLSFAASGTPPFGSGPMSVVLDRVVRGRTKLDGVDEQLRPLLLAALDPDPLRRPQASEVMAAMQAYADHRPVTEAMTQQSLMSAHAVSGMSAADATGVIAAAAPESAPRARQADSTRMSPILDQTRMAPVAHTRVAPQSPPRRAGGPTGPSAYREPQAYPHNESYPSQRYVGAGPGQTGPSGPPQQPPYPRPPGQGGPSQPWSPNQPQPYAGGPGQQPGLGSAYPAAQGDPRIGRPMRTGTIVTLWAVFVALCTVAPLLAWLLIGLWSVLTRWIDRSMTGLVMRRHEAGLRRSDIPMTLLAAPLRLIPATLMSLLWLVLPLGFAVTAAFATSVGMSAGLGMATSVEDPIPIAVGSALGAVIGWWGPGSVSMRRGTRTLIRASLPAGLASQMVLTFLTVGAVALGVWALLGGEPVSWWPNPSGDAPLIDRISPQLPGQGIFRG